MLGILSTIRPGYVLLGLGLMFCFVGCEAMCSKLILARLGHHLPYRRCLGYSFTGFYVSSITPPLREGSPPRSITCPKTAYPRPTAPSI
ncbi:MAG: lysylphosphatidylglycerol synthase domain-containing protein [Intestinimonas sp.]